MAGTLTLKDLAQPFVEVLDEGNVERPKRWRVRNLADVQQFYVKIEDIYEGYVIKQPAPFPTIKATSLAGEQTGQWPIKDKPAGFSWESNPVEIGAPQYAFLDVQKIENDQLARIEAKIDQILKGGSK